MAAGWIWPLLTSMLRLVFISTLTVVNCLALYKVVSSKKYKAGKRQERLLVTTIIIVSLVYLTVVWAPFTFSALKHDLNDLREQQLQAPKVDLEEQILFPKTLALSDDILINTSENQREDEFTVEYIDLAPSLDDIFQGTSGKEEEFTVEYVDLVNDEEHQPPSQEFVLEYIDIETGETVDKMPPGTREARSASSEERDLEAEWTVFFHSQPDFQPDISLSPAGLKSSVDADLENGVRAHALSSWNSDVQDFVTSSCAYSLAFTAVVRVVLLKRFDLFPDGPWVLGVWSGLVVGIPGAITLLVRNLARTSTHFAPHQPEYSSTGYFLYNIICDVHISEEYVVSVFLEWATLFTLLMIMLALVFAVAVRTHRGDVTENYGTLQQEGGEGNSRNIETWARDVVLAVGAIWSWPIKPIVVLILYCLYGSHWTNVVCWMAHVVVAIPVVFIPLAVFLSRSNQDKSSSSSSSMDIYVIDQDPKLGDDAAQTKDKITAQEEQEALGGIPSHYFHSNVDKVQNTDIGNNIEDVAGGEFETRSETQSDQGRGHVKENLKFYLGKDIFKNGLKASARPEDKQIILDNEWGETSISSEA